MTVNAENYFSRINGDESKAWKNAWKVSGSRDILDFLHASHPNLGTREPALGELAILDDNGAMSKSQNKPASQAVAAGSAPAPKAAAKQLARELRAAAEAGRDAEVRELLARGADAKSTGSRGVSALFLAASEGHDGCVEALLGASEPGAADSFGRTALMRAAEEGHVGCVELLAAAGDVEAACRRDGFTALALALVSGEMEAAEILMGAGAKLSARLSGGGSLLCEVIANGPSGEVADTVAWIVERAGPSFAKEADGLGRLPLHWAVLKVDEDCVRLLAHISDLGWRDAAGRAPLSLCADAQPPERAARLARLLAPGSNHADLDRDGLAPLMRAARRGDAELVEALALEEALSARDPQGRSALDWALAEGRGGAAELLRARMLALAERAELGREAGEGAAREVAGPRL